MSEKYSNIDALKEETTLLIAGPGRPASIEMIRRSSAVLRRFVISTWEGSDLPYPSEVGNIVHSALPDETRLRTLHNSQNIYLQVTTVLAGLAVIDTPYVIKARSDEYFSNIHSALRYFNPQKLLTSNIFVRGVDYAKYHISDHLFIGQTQRLRAAFGALKIYIESHPGCEGRDPYGVLNDKTPAEVKIGIFYLLSCGYDPFSLLSSSPAEALGVMKKEFDVFDVECLKPYCVRSSVAGDIECLKTFVGYDRRLDLRYIKTINQFSARGRVSDFAFRIARRGRGLLRNLVGE